MAEQKIRAFLDTNVLLQYLRGKAELQALFSPTIQGRVSFATNGVVLQELILARGSDAGIDLDRLAPEDLEVLDADLLASSDVLERLRALRSQIVHANDLMILASSRECDVLLTYDKRLLELGESVDVKSETPEEFLHELKLAS